MEFEAYLLAILTGFVSSVGTVAAIKTDITWLKISINKLDQRVTKLEEKKHDKLA